MIRIPNTWLPVFLILALCQGPQSNAVARDDLVIYINEGESMLVTCTCDKHECSEQPVIRYPQDMDYTITSAVNITVYNTSDDTYKIALQRPNTVFGDTGWYTCSGKTDDDDTGRMYVYVESNSSFFTANFTETQTLRVNVGKAVTVPCRPTCPDYKVSFTIDNEEEIVNEDSYDPKYGLKLQAVSMNHSVVCSITEDNRTQKLHYFVEVTGPQSNAAIRHYPVVYFNEGEPLVLACKCGEHRCSEQPEFRYPEDMDYTITSAVNITVYNTSDGTYTTELQRPNAVFGDTGWYICSRKPDDLEKWTYVYVESNSSFFTSNFNETQTLRVNVGKAVTVPCRPTCPDYKVSFTIDNEEVIVDEGSYDPKYGLKLQGMSLNHSVVCSITEGNRTQKLHYFVEVTGEKEEPDEPNKPDEPNEPNLWIIFIVVLVVICVIVLICVIIVISLSIKVHREKVMRKDLMDAGLKRFMEGTLESLNPKLTVQEQAELLPYEQKWEFPRERLDMKKQLGSGAFGVVVKAKAWGICENEAVTTVAVKKVKNTSDSTSIRALATELKIMVHLGNHLNIVNLLGACTTNIPKRELLVIVEYCRFGNLQIYLLKHRTAFINQIDPASGKLDTKIALYKVTKTTSAGSSESRRANSCDSIPGPDTVSYITSTDCQSNSMLPDDYVLSYNLNKPGLQPICTQDLLSWAFQVARGMEYLGQRKVLHGDLAARNILLTENNVAKICDFGLAKALTNCDNYIKNTNTPLPVKWMAIESIRDRIFSTQSDVWSFGIVLWEFFTLAEIPYPGIVVENVYQKLLNGYRMEQPKFATKEVYDIMLECWNENPTLRPTFTNLVSSIGNLMEESVKDLYVDLNALYLDMNKKALEGQKHDYLTMMSAPDYGVITSPTSKLTLSDEPI